MKKVVFLQPFLLLTEDIAGSVCLLVVTCLLEIFQKKLFQCLDGLSGIHCVADDIMITGRGETEKDALIDHDNNLIALMKRCRDVDIPLNPDKMILRQNYVPFLGHIITAYGLKPDPDKVKAIDVMPLPIDIKCVQRFKWVCELLGKVSSQTQ